MLDEFGETPSIYVWPADAEEGWERPEDFWDRVREGLASVGIDYETV